MAKSIYMACSDNADDLSIYKELGKHFVILTKNKLINIVDKQELFKSTSEVSEVIQKAKKCDFIIPMISIDYLNDENSMKVITGIDSDTVTIIPVLARTCAYQDMPEFQPYLNEVLPTPHESIKARNDETDDKDAIFSEISQRIKKTVLGEISEFKIESNKRFFYLAILCFVIGIASSALIFTETDSLILFILVLLLFMILSVISLSKYLVNKTTEKR